LRQYVSTSDRQTYCAIPQLSEAFNDDVREWLVHLARHERLLKETAKQQAGIKIKKEGLHLWKNE
jgi:exoribonuclease II